ncbi:hypothetical protein [Halobacillus litoralis]|nr:hypothetical protein [Halobacillus litoralis]
MGLFMLVLIIIVLYLLFTISDMKRMIKKQQTEIEEVKSLMKVMIKGNQK